MRESVASRQPVPGDPGVLQVTRVFCRVSAATHEIFFSLLPRTLDAPVARFSPLDAAPSVRSFGGSSQPRVRRFAPLSPPGVIAALSYFPCTAARRRDEKYAVRNKKGFE